MVVLEVMSSLTLPEMTVPNGLPDPNYRDLRETRPWFFKNREL